jgi:transposase InsO family protein
MGPINLDQLRTIFFLNCLSDSHEALQSTLMAVTDDSSFSSKTIMCRFAQEDSFNRRRTELNPQMTSALAAQTCSKPRTLCSNCKRPSHLIDFCVQLGGKMAGRSIDDAKAAQCASAKSRVDAPTVTTAKLAATDAKATLSQASGAVVIGGITYYPTQTQTSIANLALHQSAHIEAMDSDSDDSGSKFSWHSYLALTGPVQASIDWNDQSAPLESPSSIEPMVSSVSHALVAHATEYPFILDSGASNHISPERSDFHSLRPIAPHPIHGFNGSSTNAIGIGNVDLCIASGHKLSLKDILYILSCSSRLISVNALTHHRYNFVTFRPEECWVADKDNKVLVCGSLSPSSHLYTLNCTSARVRRPKKMSLGTSSALYARRIPTVETWHRRLGHCNNRTIIDMAHKQSVKGMPIDLSSSLPRCDHCILGKQTRSPVPKVWEGVRASKPLERVFVDLCGPMPCVSKSGRLYSMNVIDDFSSFVWSLPLKKKSDAAKVLQGWHQAVVNQSNHKLKILVTDNGELVSNTVSDWCSAHGINHQRTAPYTSAQNGRAEHLHRTILGHACSMRLACNAPASLWDEFCATAVYLANFTVSSTTKQKTPYELWFNRAPSLSHLCEIGCRAFALIQTNNPKLFHRSMPCTLIGYAPHSKAYRLWDNTTGAVFNSFHVTFVEHLDAQPADLLPGTTILFNPDTPPSWETPIPSPFTSPPISSALLSSFSPLADSHDLLPLSISDPSLSVDHVLLALVDSSMEPVVDTGDDPLWSSALTSPEREYWIAGAREELQSLKDLQVFVLVPRSSVPSHRRPLCGKLVCRRKRDDSGNIARYKVRYVAKGYAQIYGVDYDQTTAPTARLESFRLILHFAASLNWDLQQFDIKTTFLHGVLPPDEIAYMEQPPRFEEPGKEDWVMRLSKSIYGMKQASRIWNKTFHDAVSGWGFKRMENEWCIYHRASPTRSTMFALHVDDIICTSSSPKETERFHKDLLSHWEISALGPAKFALGIAITRNIPSRSISISQSTFIDHILERFGQSDAHSCDTPMVPGSRLQWPDPSSPVDPTISSWMARTPYRELVRSLNYLAVATRPDIAYVVGRLASFLDCYREDHWLAAIRILRYIKGTRSLTLTLGGSMSPSLIGYVDADYANCTDTSHSISGYCFSLGSGIISWLSQKQRHHLLVVSKAATCDELHLLH